MIRSLVAADNYVIAVEHDLSILDYLSDFICMLYGNPGVYGVVTMPYSVREGINIFLAGFIPTENLRFRDDELTFKVVENDTDKEKAATEEKFVLKPNSYRYPAMIKTLDSF
jgi:ATP-binding cassette subfamily E protein 1